MAGNNELGVLGILVAIAAALYIVTWTIAGPPGTVELTPDSSLLISPELAIAQRAQP